MPGVPKKSPSSSTQKTLLSFFSSKSLTATMITPTEPAKTIKTNNGEELVGLTTPPRKKVKTDEADAATAPATPPLTPEQRKLIQSKAVAAKILRHSQTLTILDAKMGPSWYSALEGEFKKDYFQELNTFVTSARSRATIYPSASSVWEWTRGCALEDVKIVILGQDPYHGPNQAHGLCFSVQKGVTPPPSLVNMYKELESDIPRFKHPGHGYLLGWANQGVLLLNAVLTVQAGQANSHKDKGWERLTDAVISYISKHLDGVVFLLWGAYAQKKAAVVDKNRHHLLQTVHPSPLSAHRGFFGCKHFSKANELLEKAGKKGIDWSYLP